ncbi:MAG: aminopeptidase P family protein [Phycisphaeraceae bacterium]|nr:aminopeptidase P family protein [Phycisphaeraceae bacterium]
MSDESVAFVRAGVPTALKAVYHAVRFAAHDPVIVIDFSRGWGASAGGAGGHERVVILRDVELERARREIRNAAVHVYADFAPAVGLSADREIASAQSAAECLRRRGVRRVRADRSLPLVYAHEMRAAGVEVECDAWTSIMARRAKSAEEVALLRRAQGVTEEAIRMACETIGRAKVRADGVLIDAQRGSEAALTSERVKSMIDVFLMERGFTNPGSIVAGGPIGADCHHGGAGELRTGEAVIVDVFPCDSKTFYNGDCTRMVVNGPVPESVAAMHAAVVEAKAAAISAIHAGATGDAVHAAAVGVITRRGYRMGFAAVSDAAGKGGMPHGTGHGIGLDLKEPPLLDKGGPELIVGDAVTVEPGVYKVGLGGMRIEDMVIVTLEGCENLNRLPEGLTWA